MHVTASNGPLTSRASRASKVARSPSPRSAARVTCVGERLLVEVDPEPGRAPARPRAPAAAARPSRSRRRAPWPARARSGSSTSRPARVVGERGEEGQVLVQRREGRHRARVSAYQRPPCHRLSPGRPPDRPVGARVRRTTRSRERTGEAGYDALLVCTS